MNLVSFTGLQTFDQVINVGNTTSNTVQFTNTNTSLVTLGRVGIGTTNPGQKLSIYTGSTATSALSFDRFSSGNYRTDIYQNQYGPDFRVGYDAYTPESILYLKRFSDGRKEVEINGNVGIGTTSPSAKLHINTGATENAVFTKYETTGNGYGGIEFRGTRGPGTGGSTIGQISSYWQNNVRSRIIFNDGGDISILPTRNVGIGTATPYAKLHVNGTAGALSSASRAYFAYFDSSTAKVQYNSGNWGGMSIYATGNIATGVYFVSHAGAISASDERIKKNIVDADDAECLETLRLLKPKKYQYKDEINRGQEPVWGFIAQEVRDTLPYATELRRDVLPNIYELANVSQSNVITFVNFNTSNLESNATTLIRTKGIDGEDHDIHLVEVIDEHTIRVEEDLSKWTGSVDAEGNVITEITTTTLTPEEYEALEDKTECVANISGYQNANVVISVEEYNGLEDTTDYEEVIENYTKTATTYPGTQLFVYGQEVDDFIFVKKEAIWTVATAALQEVDRQLQDTKAQLASVLARLDALENP